MIDIGIWETLKAISDPVRRSILEMLKKGKMTAGDIAKEFNITNASVSYHLSYLKKVDLIREEKYKNYIYYELNTSVFEEILVWFYQFVNNENKKEEDKDEENWLENFDYNKFNFNIYHEGFSYFIVNNYLCIYKHFVDGYGESRWRTILQQADGEVILDSIQHKCYAMGNFIQIVHNEDSEFLNTITGEIGSLGITALVDDTGKIDFERVNSINNILSIESNTLLGLPSSEEKQQAKIKKLRCDKKIND